MSFKIVVVEDELPILNNIVRKINKLDLPIELLGAVTNAEDALEFFKDGVSPPQILLTDICIPGINGLELCRLISEKYPQTKLLILTGYDDFSYAQQAIRLHITDYLLKPVSLKQLHTTLETLCNTLKKEELQQLQKNLLMSISGQPASGMFPCSFGDKPLGIFLVCIGNLLNQTAGHENIAYFNELWAQAKIEDFFISSRHKGDQFWILPEKSPNERFIITSFFTPKLPHFLFNYIKGKMGGIISINLCTCSTGIVYQDIWKTAQMERAFLRSSLIPCRSNIHTAGGARDSSAGTNEALTQLVLKGIQNQQKNLSALRSCLQALYNLPATQELLENTIKTIAKALKKQTASFSANSFSKIYAAMLEEICLQTDYDALYQQVFTGLSSLFAEVFSNALDGDALSRAVKKYIEDNYRDPVSMDSLTEVFHFSDSYIGRVFRNTYGIPPMKYLASYRIEKAKELILGNPDLNIKLIGEMVGYDDQRYFSRIFRNITGLTPSEYKNKISVDKA